jgi:membrane-bound serine protease (ClpP class)
VQAAAVKVGDVGVARSALRPYGSAEFHGVQVEAVAEGGYVQAGTALEIIEVAGNRIVVKAMG